MEQTLVIDRSNGRVLHNGLCSATATENLIIYPGDSGFSFKLLTRWSAGQAYCFEVQEWAEGSKENFIAVGDVRAFFGTCE